MTERTNDAVAAVADEKALADDKKPAASADDEAADGEAEGDESEDGGAADEEAEAHEGDAEEGEDAGEDDEQKLSRAQRRRARQKAHLQNLEQERDRLASRADAAERALAEWKEELGDEPKRESFEEEADYVAAKAAYEADKRALVRQKQAVKSGADSAKNDAAQAKVNLFRERAVALSDRYPDIQAKVLNDASLPISPAMAEVMMETEKGPEVAYYLAGHREEAARIAKMQPLAAARELGRIEATLSAPKPKTETKAPKPVPTLSGAGGSKVTKDPERMSHEQYRAWRNAGGK